MKTFTEMMDESILSEKVNGGNIAKGDTLLYHGKEVKVVNVGTSFVEIATGTPGKTKVKFTSPALTYPDGSKYSK